MIEENVCHLLAPERNRNREIKGDTYTFFTTDVLKLNKTYKKFIGISLLLATHNEQKRKNVKFL